MFTTPFAFMAAPASVSYSYLLDDYPSAGIAYSLRKLRSAYAGNCITVRRSSDNTEQNIGFVNNVLDTASLLSFVGAGDGFVKTWFDQSGNAVNATQTTNSLQPKIVSAGSLITENSKPTISFDGSSANNQQLYFSPNISQPNTVFIVAKTDGSPSAHFYDTINRQLVGSIGTLASYAGSLINYGINITTFQLVSALFSGSNSDLQSNNGTIVTGNAGTAGLASPAILMAGWTSQPGIGVLGVMSEFIVYPSDQTSNRSGIKSNINSFYSIY